VTARKHGDGARTAIFEALTGRRGADVEAAGTGVRGMLMAAFGASKRDPERPNTRAAADALGVDIRTVGRWLARPDQQHSTPKPENLEAIQSSAQAAARTKAGRSAALADTRAGNLANKGMSITVKGTMGPSSDPDGSAAPRANRKSIWNLAPGDAQRMLDAYESGGENGALRYLMDNAHLYGMDTWHFGTVSGFDVRPLYGAP
jgi:hypothetical protein